MHNKWNISFQKNPFGIQHTYSSEFLIGQSIPKTLLLVSCKAVFSIFLIYSRSSNLFPWGEFSVWETYKASLVSMPGVILAQLCFAESCWSKIGTDLARYLDFLTLLYKLFSSAYLHLNFSINNFFIIPHIYNHFRFCIVSQRAFG